MIGGGLIIERCQIFRKRLALRIELFPFRLSKGYEQHTFTLAGVEGAQRFAAAGIIGSSPSAAGNLPPEIQLPSGSCRGAVLNRKLMPCSL